MAHFFEVSHSRRQRGAAMVMVVGLAFLSIVLLAFTVNLTLLFLARETNQHHLRFAALKAVETYMEEPCRESEEDSECHERRLLLAMEQVNDDFDFEEHLLGNSEPLVLDTASSDNPDATARLTAGRWLIVETDGTDECPPGESVPCFKEVSEEFPFASAMRVTTKSTSGVSAYLLGSFFGSDQIHIPTYATAAVVPRRGCFVVDISRSASQVKHLRADDTTSPYQEFLIEEEERSVWEFPAAYAFFLSVLNDGVEAFQPDDDQFELLKQNDPRPESATLPDTVHFADDYVVKKRLTDSCYNLNPEYSYHHPSPGEEGGRYSVDGLGDWFTIDTEIDPEPLTTIMRALNKAFAAFEERAVSGDRACLVLYDSALQWPRIVKMTSNFQYLQDLTNFDDDGTLASDSWPEIEDSQLTDAAPGRERSIRHSIFNEARSYSDMYLAIEEAIKQIFDDQREGVLGSYFILHIGDGLANCKREDEGRICSDEYDFHFTAIQNVQTLAVSADERGIPIHIMLVGDHVGPNTVDLKNPDASTPDEDVCYSDSEARALGLSDAFTRGCLRPDFQACSISELRDSFTNASAANPYLQINRDLYEIAVLTKGYWKPIRPIGGTCPILPLECIPATVRFEDPECRSVQEQMDDGIGDIIGQNPYSVVELD